MCLALEYKDKIEFFSVLHPLVGMQNNRIGLRKNEPIYDRGSTSEEVLDHLIKKEFWNKAQGVYRVKWFK